MSKQLDWAERKARKYAVTPQGDVSPFDRRFVLLKDALKLLRAERRRAVRVCRKERTSGGKSMWSNDMIEAYNQACDDCCDAIKGKP